MDAKRDIYKSSRVLYIIESALTYFISILVGSTYLAKLGVSIGLDDGTIGLVTSFLSLGCAFQIVAVFFSPNMPAKPLVVTTGFLNQLCFTLLYFLAFLDLPYGVSTGLFTPLLLVANILLNVAFSPKAIWSRNLVDKNKLGKFSASCEIVSLISGMLFTFFMGSLVDYFEARGEIKTAFLLIGITMLVITLSNTVILLSMKEKPRARVEVRKNPLVILKECLTDRATLLLIPVYVLWYAALYISTPFFSVYAINDLGFTMTALSLLSAAYAIIRSLVSRPIGAYADKSSFVNSLTIGFALFWAALLTLCLGGKLSYIVYFLLYGVALAATNSGQLNLIYEFVSTEKRSNAVAILYTIGGLTGFLTTTAVKPLVTRIQENGSFLGIEGIYAQQVLAVMGAVIVIALIIYINLVVRRLPRPDRYILSSTEDNATDK